MEALSQLAIPVSGLVVEMGVPDSQVNHINSTDGLIKTHLGAFDSFLQLAEVLLCLTNVPEKLWNNSRVYQVKPLDLRCLKVHTDGIDDFRMLECLQQILETTLNVTFKVEQQSYLIGDFKKEVPKDSISI